MFEYLIFDLDDTLLDTYHLLIPQAVNKSAQKFKQITGLQDLPITDFATAWNILHTDFSGRDLFEKIITQLLEKNKHSETPAKSTETSLNAQNITDLVYESFLKPDLPENLQLPKETHELLNRLQQHYKLILVTQGILVSQQAKIIKLDITHYFKNIYIVNSPLGESKTEAFKKILTFENRPPDKFLSIGNRLSHEIAMAKKIGMKTCHVDIGEHKDEKPTNIYEIADWTIYSLLELEGTCQL
jgi:FMN phosphatase YigB (HAD superfamily)